MNNLSLTIIIIIYIYHYSLDRYNDIKLNLVYKFCSILLSYYFLCLINYLYIDKILIYILNLIVNIFMGFLIMSILEYYFSQIY